MTDVIDLTEVFSETLARVRARMDADANMGLSQDDPAFIDTREGSFYWDMTQPSAMECARLWDAMTETVAAAFPSTAWGDYLDEHAATFGLTRDPAIAATGQLTFITDQATLIAQGTQASSIVSQTGDTITFQTTETGTSISPLPVPSGVVVTPSNTGGVLVAGTRYYHVTALNQFGETTGSADLAGTTTTNTGTNTITWTAIPGATAYRIYVTQTNASLGQLVNTVAATTTFVDDGTVTPGQAEPSINTTSGITLAAAASTVGTAGNVAANAVTSLNTVLADVLSVTNPVPMSGGTEEEADEDLRTRVMGEFVGTSGGGNVTDYKRWTTSQGVARTTVVPVWNGPGTVLVIAMNSDGSPVASTVLASLQQYLDPVPGLGSGQAPVGATVTVVTSTILAITIIAGVDGENGYTLDGTANTIAMRSAILASLTAYLQGLQPGDTLVYQHLQAAFFITGVHKVTGLTINGGVADIVLGGGTTPQVATLGTVTLTDV
jgi:uncharacterized phage protein gp47/JayE